MAYAHLAFLLPKAGVLPETIKAAIDSRYAKNKKGPWPSVRKEGDKLAVIYEDGYHFFLHFVSGEHVTIEAGEIADHLQEDWAGQPFDKEQLRRSASRIEFYGEQDADMNHFNDSLFLLEEIEAAGNMIIIPVN